MMRPYDYVVVGAGSAGCVLAARLSENPEIAVLLLEAGPRNDNAAMRLPAAWPTLIGSDVDWGNNTVAQTAMDGAVHPYPRGKVLGGSSGINGMGFLRGHHSNYDEWAASGADGWTYDDLLPFFRRSETAAGRDSYYRGIDGPMRVAAPPAVGELADAFHAAAIEVGHPVSSDLNGKEQEGVSWMQMNIVGGVRQSTADGYLRPILHRPNLTVLDNARVLRVTVSAGRAIGVDYEHDGHRSWVAAEREIVLCAGAIGSAQLLMLSGIGPADHLRTCGIDPVADLPGVGSNLQDHPLSGIVYSAPRPPQTLSNHGDIVAHLRSDPELDAPDVQLLLVDVPYHPAALTGPAAGYTICVAALRPRSRGNVRLADGDPSAPPLIDPNYLSDDRDLAVLVAGLKMARTIGAAAAMTPWRVAEVLPGPHAQTDDELRQYLRRGTGPYFHASGTCRMGVDPLAVVNAELRVHGIDALRVVDASVMPHIVGANTYATVLAIAERAAALITV